LPLFILLVVHFILFITPGLSIAWYCYNKKFLTDLYVIPATLIFSSLTGYVSFWLYLYRTQLGILYSISVLIVCLIWIIYLVRTKKYITLKRTNIIIPVLIMFIVSLFYASTVFSCQSQSVDKSLNTQCHLNGITIDNLIPQIFAENVYQQQPTRLIGDWHGSDRPPLQSGITLLQSPFTLASSWRNMSYELLAVVCQCMWIAAVWLYGKKLRLRDSQLAFLLGFCIFSGFFFFNSVFTWPKLIAGTLVLFATAIIYFEKRTLFYWTLAATAAGLGLLAHSSAIFTLVPFGMLVVANIWKNRSLNLIVLPLATLCLLVGPWLLYQKLYDPPGDRLVKWHIGGSEKIDNRSFSSVFISSYNSAGFEKVLANKLSNIRTLFGRIPPESHLYSQGFLGRLYDGEFRYVLFGLGVVNLGWIVLIINLRRKKYKPAKQLHDIKNLIMISLLALALWSLALFGPNTTSIHQGSYATFMLLFICLGSLLATLPKRYLKPLFLVQFSYFITIWIITIWLRGKVNFGMILVSIFSIILTLLLLFMIKWNQEAFDLQLKSLKDKAKNFL
jgi:hypothetical protein